jgi:hypothetical protein
MSSNTIKYGITRIHATITSIMSREDIHAESTERLHLAIEKDYVIRISNLLLG